MRFYKTFLINMKVELIPRCPLKRSMVFVQKV